MSELTKKFSVPRCCKPYIRGAGTGRDDLGRWCLLSNQTLTFPKIRLPRQSQRESCAARLCMATHMEPISPIFFDCNSGCALAKSMKLSKNSSFKEGSPWLATTVKARATTSRSSSGSSAQALRLFCSDNAELIVLETRAPAKAAAIKFHFCMSLLPLLEHRSRTECCADCIFPMLQISKGLLCSTHLQELRR
jgi:hypothetical protein